MDRYRIRLHRDNFAVEVFNADRNRWRLVASYRDLSQAAHEVLDKTTFEFNEWSGQDLESAIDRSHKRLDETLKDVLNQLAARQKATPNPVANPKPPVLKKKKVTKKKTASKKPRAGALETGFE